MNQLLFLAVPGGRPRGSTGPGLLRVVIVPRLESGTLASNGLTSWPPAQLREPLQVTFRAGPGQPESAPVRVVPEVFHQTGVWEAFFGAAVVNPRPPAPSGPDGVAVKRSAEHAATVGSTYAAAAATITRPDDPAEAGAFRETARQQVSQWRPAPTSPPPAGSHRPPADPADVGVILGRVREFPAVMRALGLIVELELPAGALPAAARGELRVGWPTASVVTPALPPVTSRWTVYDRAPFLPAGSPDLSEGMVRLDDPAWTLLSVDVDSAVARLRAAAASTAPVDGLPALRTAGLSLARLDRAADLAVRGAGVVADGQLDAGPAELPSLTAADLALGYRIDASVDGTGQWHPLCKRQATYTVRPLGAGHGPAGADAPVALTIGSANVTEEGHVKAHSGVRDEQGVVAADQIVTRWSGWSLVVPDPRTTTLDRATSPPAGAPYDLQWRYRVNPGSLLPLRFGAVYRLRARVADLAGGGLAMRDPQADHHPSTTKRFGRHEPVLPPVLSVSTEPADPPTAFGPGVRIDQLVVRSPGGPQRPPALPSEPVDVRRSLTPPPGSVDLALQHGVLSGTAAATWATVEPFVRDGGVLADCASRGVQAHLRPSPDGPDGPASTRTPDDWRPEWPVFDDKVVVLQERVAGDEDTPTLQWDDGRLVVSLAPAEHVEIELSSTLPTVTPHPEPEAVGPVTPTGISLQHFDLASSLTADAAVTTSLEGRHPLVTPPRTLTCVHAVIRPLADPAGTVVATRAAGELVAVLSTPGVLGAHVPSTAQLEIAASWTEVDDGVRTHVSAPVQTVTLPRGATGLGTVVRHPFPDTRYRAVTYTVTAVSRFQQYFVGVPDLDFLAPAVLPDVVPVLSTARPAPPLVRSVAPAFTWTETVDAGVTVRTRHGGRVRVELARPWFTTGEGEQLGVIVSHTPGGAPVDSLWPSVTQVGRDPAWTLHAGDSYEVTGGGLAGHFGWVESEWAGAPPTWQWIPDEAEVLTVVPGPPLQRWPGAVSIPSAVATQAVTLPGSVLPPPPESEPYDPVAESLYAAALTTAVDVAAHDVFRVGDSWYADVAIADAAQRSYCPLVQLAVARYQPHSLDGLLLSDVVRTDFVPLLPDRTLRVDLASSPDHVTVTLAGWGPRNRVDVILERGGPTADGVVAVGPTADRSGVWEIVPGGIASGVLGDTLVLPIEGDPFAGGLFPEWPAGDVPVVPGPLRVRVREVEQLPGAPAPAPGTPGELAERVVFTDLVTIR